MANLLNASGMPHSLSGELEAPTKRISTPAGLRLSVIMENTIDQKSRPRRTSKSGTLKSGTVSKGSTLVGDPRESREGRDSGPMGYSYDIFSEKGTLPPPTLSRRLKTSQFIQRKGGWKRFLLVVVLLLLCLIAIVVGTTVGLRKQSSNNDDDGAETASQNSDVVPATAGAASTTGVGSSPVSTSEPPGFPAGTYSFTTFLDTVTPDCTPDPNTWTCFPFTIYNDDHAKSLSTFDWVIEEGSSEDTYSISSVENPFAINFQNAAMRMLDKGGKNERYQFQITMDKMVIPSSPITEDGSTATCFFNSTTMTGYLYTKQAKDYPTADEASGNTTHPAWPYAVRVEQTAAGGEDTPNCYQTINGALGAQVGNFTAGDPTTLCSCLYRNFLTPGS